MTWVRCVPLDAWAGPRTAQRRRAPFSAGWARTFDDLERELELLDATDARIGIDLLPSQIRLDGWPKAGASAPPPVVLTFESQHGALRFQCDRYDDWRANLRAIGLTLQRLRLVDEGGVTRGGEQYRGFAALLPGGNGTLSDAAEAARLVLRLAGMAPDEANALGVLDGSTRTSVYRLAARKAHPDQGGTAAQFAQLQGAMKVLEGVRR